MNNNVKYIAFYLPQFHQIPENDKWWGEGFTEWTNVKKATPLFKGHRQPIIPGELGYYDLTIGDIQERQSTMAMKYGIHAFCYYHYWMGDGNMLLERPAELMLKNKAVKIPFCFCWANENWTRSWYDGKDSIIHYQKYGDEVEIRNHLKYLYPFFKDERYLRKNGKVVLSILSIRDIPNAEIYISTIRQIAKKDFNLDLYLIGGYYDNYDENEFDKLDLDDRISPNHLNAVQKINNKFLNRIKFKLGVLKKPLQYEYSKIVSEMKNDIQKNAVTIPIVIPNWDNTPRHNTQGKVYVNFKKPLFEELIQQAISQTSQRSKNDFIFIKSWNEWAEGNYLEPDSVNGYTFLEAIKDSLI
jgi:lipopolysaccharide biosynthesis protein